MSTTLKNIEARDLPPAWKRQAGIRDGETVNVTITSTTTDDGGRDAYQEYVDAQLEKGLADVRAGRGEPIETAFPRLQAEMKAKYGAV